MNTEFGNSIPLVAIIMGSKSDWETMRHASTILTELVVPHECRIVSAHRTPNFLSEYVGSAQKSRGIHVLIAGAGGAVELTGPETHTALSSFPMATGPSPEYTHDRLRPRMETPS
ncbi:MAG: AIR carboxylase family protein [Nitrospirales bacterium]|nr:AIR carboxylase family protein [Nitrospirales bacterium]